MPTEPKLPKFDALRGYLDQTSQRLQGLQVGDTSIAEALTPVVTWVNKLEEWCKDRLTEIEQAEATVHAFEEDIALRSEEDMREAYDELTAAIHDFRRGLTEWPDIERMLPNPLGERPAGGPL